VQNQTLEEMKFWLDQGVDGFRLDTVNYYFHDQQLRDNPALPETVNQTAKQTVNPYDFQKHLYDKNRPESICFAEKMRALTDTYSNRMMVGEIGDKQSEKMMQDYTGGDNHLHTAYSFRLLSEEFSAAHLARVIKKQEELLTDGWPTWAFSNHDVTRVATRWGVQLQPHQQKQMAKALMTLLCCLRGSICIYQGEELGLPEAEIEFEQLQDPWGINLWPEFKGRDGCRTPIPWEAKEKHGGFSSGMPWLPVPDLHHQLAIDIQQADADSMLSFSRKALAFRTTQQALKTGDISNISHKGELLSFYRHNNQQKLRCLFWLGAGKSQIDFDQPDVETLLFSTVLTDKDTALKTIQFNGPGALVVKLR